MTIEQKSKNCWRISKSVDGVRYRVTVDHKPTKSEAEKLIMDEIVRHGKGSPDKMTFSAACDLYINSKNNILSPSTIRGYRSISHIIPKDIMNRQITAITNRDIQVFINRYSVDHSPKRVKNAFAFINSVLKFSGIELDAPNLPQKVKTEQYIPTTDDIQRILDYSAGTDYEVPLTLAAFGLRRSEILAVTADKLDGDILTIDSAIVENNDGDWVQKVTKTTESTRTIEIPEDIAEKIRENGTAYNGSPKMINQTLQKYQRQLGIPKFSLHKMRHFFCSYMHQKGYTDSQIQAMGGWKTDHVMKSVYRHAMEMENVKKNVCSDLSSLRNNTKKTEDSQE